MSLDLTLRTRLGAAVAVPLLVAAALSAGWFTEQRDSAVAHTDSSLRATVASSVTVVRTDLRDQLSAAPTAPGASVVDAARLDTRLVSRDVAATARDSGSATLDDTGRVPAIVVPVYGTAFAPAVSAPGVTAPALSAPAVTAPADTSGRRRLIRSYRVVPLRMNPVLSRLAPDVGGIAVRGPDRSVTAVPRSAPAGARGFTVDMDITGAPGWAVSAWRPAPGVPAVAWVGMAVLLLAGLVVATVLTLLLRRLDRSRRREQALDRDRDTVTGLAPVLQASLDIGEVIPAVAWHLADSLQLAGLSLATPGEAGERQLFGWGEAPDPNALPGAGRITQLAGGQTYAVALARGGRALGVLRVVAGEPLDADRLVSLRTAGELLGSTLANAEAYARQQEVVESMRSVDELKTVFLATASHELRTPTTAIVGFTGLLLDQWSALPPERALLLVERVMANGQRLSALIEQLLDFSRLERGLPRTPDELVNIGATIARILDEHDDLVADHQLEVVIANDGLVRGSTASVERIVTNLVGNAVKYSPAGTRITVTVRCEQDAAVLTVDDEGPGVPEADRERVFSRFYRGSGDTVTRTRGAGIGLAIVSEYVASMSGSASVEASPAGGARFVVTLPAVGMPAAALVEGKVDVAVS